MKNFDPEMAVIFGILAILSGVAGFFVGPDYEDVKAYIETPGYKAQERLHIGIVDHLN